MGLAARVRNRIVNDGHVIVKLDPAPYGRRNTNTRHYPHDNAGRYPQIAQDRIERGIRKAVVTPLDDHMLALVRFEFLHDLRAPAALSDERAVAAQTRQAPIRP